MGGVIGGLLLAWILSWFGVDRIIIDGVNELFKLNIGIAGYYVLFAIVGIITHVLTKRK
jgi:hypothetical protein